MACSIQLGVPAFLWTMVDVLHKEDSPVRSQGCYYLHLCQAPSGNLIFRMQGASSILRHFILLRIPRHWRDYCNWLARKKKRLSPSNSSVKLIYKLERNNDISSSCSEVNYASPWIVSLTNKPACYWRWMLIPYLRACFWEHSL